MSSALPFLDEHHRELQTRIRQYCSANLLPHVAEWDVQGVFPIPLLRDLGRAGFLGIDIPQEYGGGGRDAVSACIIAEETGKAGGGVNASLLQSSVAIQPIWKLGTEEQKRKYLPAAIRGERIAAIAMTEPEVGSDVAAIATTAKRDGDSFVLNGSKMFITNGAICDFALSLFIVEPGRRDSKPGANWTSWDGAPPIPVNCDSRIATCRRQTCSAGMGAGSTI
jgi:acyl-CoA dehydrogenase